MNTECIYVDCPVCKEQLELVVEIEPADPSVGFDRPSIERYPTAPTVCPAEDHPYTLEERKELMQRIQRECDRWEPERPPKGAGWVGDDD